MTAVFCTAIQWHYKNMPCAANVAPQTGREYEESQKIRAETTYNINVRYFPGITSDMKIMYGVKIFNIVSVLDINERHTNLKIVAAEVDRNGCQ